MGKSKDLATLKDSGLTVSSGGLSVSGANGDILNVSSTTGSEFAMHVDGNETVSYTHLTLPTSHLV